MEKKITSVIKIENSNANLKVGTINKKNPTVVYFEGGFYIKPSIKKDNYFNDITEVKAELDSIVKNYINHNETIKKDYMFFTDIAEERIMFNKKSFLSFQLYVKPTENTITKNRTFKNIANDLGDEKTLVEEFKSILEKNGFVTSKTKS